MFVLQKCFLVSLLKAFYSNLRKELTKMPKIYFRDNGLRNVALSRFTDFHQRGDNGALLENYVFRTLTEKYGTDGVRFWRTADKKEIDFVVSPDNDNKMAFEIKMKCRPLKMNTIRKFNSIYPSYLIEIVSYEPAQDCRWILKI